MCILQLTGKSNDMVSFTTGKKHNSLVFYYAFVLLTKFMVCLGEWTKRTVYTRTTS